MVAVVFDYTPAAPQAAPQVETPADPPRNEVPGPAPATEASQREPVRRDGRVRILAAEDNLTNQKVLAALLEPLDVDLTMTADGEEVVAAYRAARFDLVLMDVQMPEMGGGNGPGADADPGGHRQRHDPSDQQLP
jgi:hypothetical protein